MARKTLLVRIPLVAACAVLLIIVARGQESARSLELQGRLTDPSGAPLNGAYDFTVRLYTAAGGGSPVYAETVGSVPVTAGVYRLRVGGADPGALAAAVANNADLFAGLAVGADPEMSPRIRLAAGAYALRAETLEGLDSSRFLRSDTGGVVGGDLAVSGSLSSGGDLAVAGGVALGGGTPAANTVDFGPGASDSLDATQVSVLTGGPDSDASALHRHAGQQSSGPSFAGYTTATYNGNLGGIPGANQKCAAEFPGSHLCSAYEFYLAYPTAAPSSANGAWIWPTTDSGGDPRYKGYISSSITSTNNATCSSYTASDNCNWGAIVASSGAIITRSPGGSCGTGVSLCDVGRQLACCR
jgi:hypothetical protein